MLRPFLWVCDTVFLWVMVKSLYLYLYLYLYGIAFASLALVRSHVRSHVVPSAIAAWPHWWTSQTCQQRSSIQGQYGDAAIQTYPR